MNFSTKIDQVGRSIFISHSLFQFDTTNNFGVGVHIVDHYFVELSNQLRTRQNHTRQTRQDKTFEAQHAQWFSAVHLQFYSGNVLCTKSNLWIRVANATFTRFVITF